MRGFGGAWLLRAALPLLLAVGDGCGVLDAPIITTPAQRRPAPGPATAAPDEGPDRYIGRWAGTTSQGMDLTFTVDSGDPAGGVTFIGYAWQLPGCQHQDHVELEDPAPIHDGALAVEVELPGSLLDLALRFDDADHAHGSLGFVASHVEDHPGCAGHDELTFTAGKRPE